jgi:hypothetical protein
MATHNSRHFSGGFPIIHLSNVTDLTATQKLKEREKTMNCNDMTFGIEFEVVLPSSVRIAVGGYHAGQQVAELPIGWNAQRDGSIRYGAGEQGVEIVSPILKGQDGLNQILTVLNWLHSKGAKVNSSTGLHIHVGVDRQDAVNLTKIVVCVAQYEKALYASTGTKARENSTWCRSIQNDSQYIARFRDGDADNVCFERYRSLNVTNVLGRGKPTIEFRVFAGSLNATKVITYARMCLGLVERATTLTRKTKWTAKRPVETSPLHRKGGEGQTAMCRLFYGLGWTKGQAKQVYGNVPCEISIEAGKKELMRLAKKYDAAGQ